MSDRTDGRGLTSDEFDEEEIDWGDDETHDDETHDAETHDDSEGLSPIEQMVGDSLDALVPDDDEPDDDAFDEESDDEESDDTGLPV